MRLRDKINSYVSSSGWHEKVYRLTCEELANQQTERARSNFKSYKIPITEKFFNVISVIGDRFMNLEISFAFCFIRSIYFIIYISYHLNTLHPIPRKESNR